MNATKNHPFSFNSDHFLGLVYNDIYLLVLCHPSYSIITTHSKSLSRDIVVICFNLLPNFSSFVQLLCFEQDTEVSSRNFSFLLVFLWYIPALLATEQTTHSRLLGTSVSQSFDFVFFFCCLKSFVLDLYTVVLHLIQYFYSQKQKQK